MTIWPGELRLAIAKTPVARAGRERARARALVEPDDGRHGAVAGGRLHQPAALADEPERVGEVQDARRRPCALYWPIEWPAW